MILLSQEPVFLKPGSIVITPFVADLSVFTSIATSFSDPLTTGNSYILPSISNFAKSDIFIQFILMYYYLFSLYEFTK